MDYPNQWIQLEGLLVMAKLDARRPRWTLMIGGFLFGGFVGYLLRPSAFLVGQLPFLDVITAGRTLTGIEVLYRNTAEESFNVMLVGALVGAAAAFVLSLFLERKRP